MNNTKHKHDKQDQIRPLEDQQQKTRQQQEAKKQGHPSMLPKDLGNPRVHEHDVHEQELPETRMTR